MAALIISLSDSVLSAALQEALGRNVTLDTFVEGAVRDALSNATFHAPPTVDLERLLKDAVGVARSKPAGTRFLVQELCSPQAWASTSPGERKVLGKKFRKLVEAMDDRIAEHVDRTPSNQAIYQRV